MLKKSNQGNQRLPKFRVQIVQAESDQCLKGPDQYSEHDKPADADEVSHHEPCIACCR
jgi:hypothetical protein